MGQKETCVCKKKYGRILKESFTDWLRLLFVNSMWFLPRCEADTGGLAVSGQAQRQAPSKSERHPAHPQVLHVCSQQPGGVHAAGERRCMSAALTLHDNEILLTQMGLLLFLVLSLLWHLVTV